MEALAVIKKKVFTGGVQSQRGRIFSIHKYLIFDRSKDRDYFVTNLEGLI
jgi:hypothetical protein